MSLQQLQILTENLLKIIARLIIVKRSERQEPIALKRRHTKRYSYLNKPRARIKAEMAQKSDLSPDNLANVKIVST